MAYATFNGWNIVPMPSSPAIRSVNFTLSDTVGEVSSPWTSQSQFQEWVGGDSWALDIQFPPIKSSQIGAWRAWLAALRGKKNVFRCGDPLFKQPRGNPQTTGQHALCVSDVTKNQAGASYIYTSGWVASAAGVLLPGDYLQLGERLHCVAGVDAVNADASGNATIEIFPVLREAANGLQVLTSNCTGLFRLADNKRQYSENVTRLFGLSFKCMEAR
jgi:hypothetical protein